MSCISKEIASDDGSPRSCVCRSAFDYPGCSKAQCGADSKLVNPSSTLHIMEQEKKGKRPRGLIVLSHSLVLRQQSKDRTARTFVEILPITFEFFCLLSVFCPLLLHAKCHYSVLPPIHFDQIIPCLNLETKRRSVISLRRLASITSRLCFTLVLIFLRRPSRVGLRRLVLGLFFWYASS